MQTTATQDRGALGHRLLVIGVPRHLINQFVGVWCQWVSHNGPEWAVRRFKSLKVDLIRRKAGFEAVTPYVRKNRKGDYYGVIGALFRWSDSSDKNFARALSAFCIYTSETSDRVTKTQFEKFQKAVSCDKPTGLTMSDLTEIQNVTSALIGPRTIDTVDNRLVVYRGSSEKMAPLPHGLGRTSQDRKVLADLAWLNKPSNKMFTLKHQDCYGPVLEGVMYKTKWELNPPFAMDPTSYAGEVHFLQEPGYKLRSIASPYRIHQLALLPLKEALGRIVKELPWDATYDQSKAVEPIRRRLAAGLKVHSLDLSSATDYFPLNLQVLVLRAIFGDVPDIRLFHDLSKMTWKSSLGDIAWKRGQPLGLNPSFFAFTLTHGVILSWLAEQQVDKFFVVGDDVVILCDDLFEKYRKLLERMSCPYSCEKSISSSVLAEFAGKVITQKGCYPQLKWRKMSNDSFLDLARLLGPASRELMTCRQQRVFDAVRHLLLPVGCNMSKPGGNFADSYLETEEYLSRVQQKLVGSLVDLIRPSRMNSMDDPGEHVLNVNTDTFDKKVLMVFQKTVFSHWLWLEHVSELPRALGLEPRLPLLASPQRVSTLSVYERNLIK